METVREVAFGFCVTAVMAAAVGLLCGNKLEKSMRYIVSLTLICSVLSVALGKRLDFFADAEQQTVIEYDTLPLYEYQAEYIVADLLNKEGIKFENVTAVATKNEDGSIVINEIEISGCKSREEVAMALNKVGIDCSIRVVE